MSPGITGSAMMCPLFRMRNSGHIHAGYGMLQTADTLFVNASLLGEDGTLGREPIVIDFEVRG